MALIPPDAGIRMRLQNDASLLQPTTPVSEIPTDLSELRVGQTFTASIQEVLPENTYKALVAGKQLTLQLPEGAKAGDTLDLVVVDRTPRVVIAHLAEPSAAAAAAGGLDKYTTLSPAGQMIGSLLLQEGETPQPAMLNRGQPLLAQPPATAAELAPALQKAITQSGLFYESHQAQWVAGKLPLEQLLQEPQGQRSAPATLAEHGVAQAAPETGRPAAQGGAAATPARLEPALRGDERIGASPSSRESQATTLTQAVPTELRPIVQQQLDAVTTQRLVWHGEAWPNQSMDWEIVRGDEGNTATARDEEVSWRTTLRLDTPRLGHIAASLHLTNAGITMRLAATDDTAAADLQKALPSLTAALQAAGISLVSAQVRHEHE
ncbi:MAG: flagellar hook-length control protein FliK [Rhodocyclaceae bacterium]|nr:flagellar hook-length control protein FliK [Rhodocyclaceae bacterium]